MDWSVKNMNRGVTPYRMSLDVSIIRMWFIPSYLRFFLSGLSIFGWFSPIKPSLTCLTDSNRCERRLSNVSMAELLVTSDTT